MNRVFQLFLTVTITFFTVTQATAQTNSCDALFNITSTSGLTVSFNNESVYNNPTGTLPGAQWNFGDGSVADSYDATHTFPAAGTYTVCLSAIDQNGAICDSYCETITIGNPNTTCSDFFVTLSTNSSGTEIIMTLESSIPNLPLPDPIQWILEGGGGVVGSGHTLVYANPGPGTYQFCAVYSLNGVSCPAVCATITISNTPTCHFDLNYQITGLTGVFEGDNLGGDQFTTIDWTITGGGAFFTGSGSPFTFTFPSAGTYTACGLGTLTDPLTGVVCDDDACVTFTVTDPNSPCDYHAVATNSGNTIVMTLATNDPSLPAPDQVDWILEGGGGFIGSGQTLTWVAPGNGVYHFCATYSVNGVSCMATCTFITITGNPNCEIDFEHDLTPMGNHVFEVLPNNTGTYSNIHWTISNDNGFVADGTESPFSYAFANPGVYDICVAADLTTSNGLACTVTQCHSLTITGNTNCPYEVTISNTGSGLVVMTLHSLDPNVPVPAVIDWILEGGGGNVGSGNPLTYQTAGPGDYEFCALFDSQVTGCPDFACSTITIGGDTDCHMGIGSDINGLIGLFESDNLGGPDFSSVTWVVTGGGVSWTDTGHLFDFAFPSAGTYTVCATGDLADAAGVFLCSDMACITVTVTDTPPCPIEFEYDIIDNNLSTVFEVINNPVTGAGYINIVWTITGPDGTVFSGSGSPFTATLSAAGEYHVCVDADLVNANGNIECFAHSCETIQVSDPNVPCEAFFEGHEFLNSPLPVQNQAIFFNLSSGNYTHALWDFGDGSVSDSQANDLTHIYANPGVYNVCLTVSDPNDPNCDDTYCTLIFITGVTPCNFDVSFTTDGQLFTGTIASADGSVPTVAEWYIGGTNDLIGTGHTVTHTFANPGIYEICVDYEISGTTCSGTICHDVTINNDDCALVECVFPGDANYDQIANNFDILPIGLNFGTTGPARPNASNQWYGQPGPDWQEISPDGVNYKHSDCNGNGEIGFSDIEPIMLNYNRTHDGVVPTNFGPNPPIWLEFDLDTIFVDPNSANIQISADIKVGTQNLPAQDVYGLAFTVNYPAELVEEGTVAAEYESTSFVGPSNNTLQLEMILPEENRIDFGYSRTDHQNVSGFGTVATTSYVIIDNLIGFAPQQEYEFTLSISNIRVITSTGDELQFAAQSATAIIIVDDPTTGINDPIANTFSVYPNPTNQIITIDYDAATGEVFTLYNTLGQMIMTDRLNGKLTAVDVSELSTGIYLLSIQTNEGQVTKRIVVE